MTRTTLTAVLALALTGPALAFDREVTDALKACHDSLWQMPDFADMPNAAISVWPASSEGGATKVYWVVDWTDPEVKAAGACLYDGETVTGHERF